MPGIIVPVAPIPAVPTVPALLEPEGAKPGVTPMGAGLKPPVPNCVAPNGMPLLAPSGDALGVPMLGDVTPPIDVPSWAWAPPLVRRTAAAMSGASFLNNRAIAVFFLI
jgi:hypothetical protein